MEIHIANLSDPRDATDIVKMLDAYARDPMGGGKPLSDEVKARLPGDLAAIAHCLVFLARMSGEPAGVAVCFQGYSTFAGKPLLNLHDFAVAPAFRGNGVARAMLERIAMEARRRGCCKITLEVLSGNSRAMSVYRKAGFDGYQLDPTTGHALFLQRSL